MSINILVPWVLCSCALLFHITEQKFSATNFRALPMMADKLTIAQLPSYNIFEPYGPGTYAFGYEIDDPASQNVQFRDEEKLQNGTVRGSYGLVRPNGLVSITRYFADESGYHSSTQTFSQHDKKPTLLTSTESPFLQMSSPSDVMYLDVPNPATVSPQVVQQILEQHKIDLATPASNVPITDVFSSSEDDSDSEISESSQDSKHERHPLLPNASIPPQATGEKKASLLSHNSSALTQNVLQKPTPPSQGNNILETLLPHLPKLPATDSATKSPNEMHSSTMESLSDENNEANPISTIPSSALPQLPNIFQNILPHLPQLPFPVGNQVTTAAPTKSPSTTEGLSDQSDASTSESSSPMTETTKVPSNHPSFPNIFENILPHLPQLPFPTASATKTPTPSKELSTTESSNNQADNTVSEGSSSSTQTTKAPNNLPGLPNIFENILPHLPTPVKHMQTTAAPTSSSEASNSQADTSADENYSSSDNHLPQLSIVLPEFPHLAFPSGIPNTPTVPPTAMDLADERETETPTAPEQLTSSTPTTPSSSFPPLSQIFGFLDPSKFPIFPFPSNNFPNKQESDETPNTETLTSPTMDAIDEPQTPTMEPLFAIIHKNATMAPLYDDDGNTIGIQLINNFIPSNFHIIPFFVPSNLLQHQNDIQPTQPQNIAHDEVQFEDGIPAIHNDKFHDPLEEYDPTWKKSKRKPNRKQKNGKKRQNRRNIMRRRRNRYRN